MNKALDIVMSICQILTSGLQNYKLEQPSISVVTSVKKVMFLPLFVCLFVCWLFVCLSEKLLKQLWMIFHKISKVLGIRTRHSRLNFGNSTDTRYSAFTSDNGVSTPQNHASLLRRAPNNHAQYLYVGFFRRNKIPRCSAYDIAESNPVPTFEL